jgi:membrane protein YdbS with pleckstrin-like domain
MCTQGGITGSPQNTTGNKHDSTLQGVQTMSSILTKIISSLVLLAATAISALAAAEGRNNTSEPIVWGFLGLCALIILAQIAPMILNLRKQSKTVVKQAQAEKQHQL